MMKGKRYTSEQTISKLLDLHAHHCEITAKQVCQISSSETPVVTP